MILEENDDWESESDEIENGSNLIQCPNCRQQIYSESEKCPRCSYWITDDELDADYSNQKNTAKGIKRVGLIILWLIGLAGVFATILVLLGV